MQIISICLLMFLGCTAAKNTSQQYPVDPEAKENTDHTKSKYPGIPSEPGKCYAKCNVYGQSQWVEIVCEHKVTSQLIVQISSDLIKLGYEIDKVELEKEVFGPSTKKALFNFQKDHQLPVGSINLATLKELEKLSKK